jgi:DNA-binding response OmpR family regulator
MGSLLVVEDEPHIASGLRFNLEAEGHTVRVVETGEAALEAAATHGETLDCIVLDVMLPGIDGFDVAAALRARGQFIPILMLTARGRAVLVARVHALLRRHAWHREQSRRGPAHTGDQFSFAGRTVDFDTQEVRVGDRVHPLTLMEANLLRYFT